VATPLPDPAERLRARLRSDLTAALKRRDAVSVNALRTAIAAIDNAEAADIEHRAAPATSAHIAGAVAGAGAGEAPRRTLTDDDLSRIIQEQISERRSAADAHAGLGRHDDATRLRHEADVLAEYLPGAVT
jgi:uncharacterized protein YqeY